MKIDCRDDWGWKPFYTSVYPTTYKLYYGGVNTCSKKLWGVRHGAAQSRDLNIPCP